jgi:hypothetical protein
MMRNSKKNTESNAKVIRSIDPALADGMLRIMRAEMPDRASGELDARELRQQFLRHSLEYHQNLSGSQGATAHALPVDRRTENKRPDAKEQTAAETPASSRAWAEEYHKVRELAFTTKVPELQFVALNSNDRGIKTQAWLNLYLDPSVAELMRGRISEKDKALQELAERASRYHVYARERNAEEFRQQFLSHSIKYHQKQPGHQVATAHAIPSGQVAEKKVGILGSAAPGPILAKGASALGPRLRGTT